MMHTRICEVPGIEHPIALGGMPSIFNSPTIIERLVANAESQITANLAQMIRR